MRRHLDDEVMAAVLAGVELDGPERAHLESCVVCRRQLAGLRDLVAARQAELVGQEPDWDRQRSEVMDRLAGHERRSVRRRWLRPAMVAAAAVVVGAALGVLQLTDGSGSQRDLAVEEILAETEALLGDDTIPGFEVIDPGVEELEQYLANGVS
jgi:anti-sigma factor RsiW